MANTMKALQTVTVGAGGAASISFTSIPSTYTDLYVVTSFRFAASAVAASAYISFNGSLSNFTSRYLEGNGASAGSYTSPAYFSGSANANTSTALTFSSHSIYIPNYVGSNYKSFSVDSVSENNATTAYTDLSAGLWSITEAINQITFSGASNFQQYSTATLYGVFNQDVSVAPSTPTIGTATAGGAAASITFTPVSGAASYTMTSSPGSITATGTTSPILVEGLTPGTSYTFTCKANNPLGSSGSSAASNSVIPLSGYGTTWFQSLPTTGMNRGKGLGWNGSVWVQCWESTTAAAYSSDGINWTNTTMASANYWYPIEASLGNNFVAIPYETSSTTNYTANGTTWSTGSITARSWYNMATNRTGKLMVSCRFTTYIATSNNGISWTESTVLPSSADWRIVGYGGGTKWIITSVGGGIAISTNDGASWTARTLPGSVNGDTSAGDGTTLLVVGSGSTYYTTTDDGANWTTRSFPVSGIGDIQYNGKVWVAMKNDWVGTSSDGITWTQRSTTSINFYTSAVGGSGNNTFIGLDYTASNPRNRYSTY